MLNSFQKGSNSDLPFFSSLKIRPTAIKDIQARTKTIYNEIQFCRNTPTHERFQNQKSLENVFLRKWDHGILKAFPFARNLQLFHQCDGIKLQNIFKLKGCAPTYVSFWTSGSWSDLWNMKIQQRQQKRSENTKYHNVCYMQYTAMTNEKER